MSDRNGVTITPDEATERAVIGGLLRWPQALCEVAPVLKADDFAKDAHRRIYRSIVGRWERGKAIDLAGVADELKRAGDVEDIGGYVYLADLFESEPTGRKVHQHAATVRERAILRNLALAASDIEHDAKSPTASAEEVLSNAQTRISDIAADGFGDTSALFAETLHEAMERIDARKANGGRSSGVPTGFFDLDEIHSGMHPAELTVVAARPSVGKTSLGMAFALSASRSGVPVLFVSLEQSKVELGERFLCMESRVDSHRVRNSSMDAKEIDAIINAASRMREYKLITDDRSSQSMLRIASTARREQHRHKIGLVIVDYLQLIDPDDPRMKRYEQVGVITRKLKFLAKDLLVPVVVMAQLNRESENRQAPRLSDLRESGNIEQDADVVLLMHRSELTPGPVQEVCVNVAKNRNGRCGNIVLSFVRHCMRFENHAPGIPA